MEISLWNRLYKHVRNASGRPDLLPKWKNMDKMISSSTTAVQDVFYLQFFMQDPDSHNPSSSSGSAVCILVDLGENLNRMGILKAHSAECRDPVSLTLLHVAIIQTCIIFHNSDGRLNTGHTGRKNCLLLVFFWSFTVYLLFHSLAASYILSLCVL